MNSPHKSDSSDLKGGADLKKRVVAAAGTVTLLGLVLQVLSFAGGLVLAGLLDPRQFGIVAFGTTLTVSLKFVADAGLGASLIRRRQPPQREELEAVLAFQGTGSVVLATAVIFVSLPFGQVGEVTAIMAVWLPLIAIRTPALTLLERDLAYRPIVVASVVETLAFYAWAIPGVLLGWNVWALATGTVFRGLIGSVVLLSLTAREKRILRPRFAWQSLRPILGFGTRFLAVDVINFARDQGFNLILAAVSGLSTLGLWSLAYRILQIPSLLLTPLWRVSYPAMSRLVASGEEPRPVIERVIALVAASSGLIMAPIVATAPALIPSVIGNRWADAADILPGACLGLMFGGPISVATGGYLWAVGDARTPLRATIWHTAGWFAVTLPLLGVIGVWAIGVGGIVTSLIDSILLARGALKHTHFHVVSPLAVPLCAAIVAAAVGWLIAVQGEPTLVRAVVAGGVAASVYAALLLIAGRPLLIDMIRTAGRAVHAAAGARRMESDPGMSS
jgi:O-antigen/teichoic acid export membrane protein